MRLLGIAASGVRGQQTAIDILGNNMANVNTVGFKAKRLNFAETLDQEIPAVRLGTNDNPGVGTLNIGVGVLNNATGANFNQGSVLASDDPMHLAISGAGFFQIRTPDGEIAYTRAGVFQVNMAGQLVDPEGNFVATDARIPEEAKDVAVRENGDIIGVINGESVVLGRLTLATFPNAEGLSQISANLYSSTVNSGGPLVGQPGSVAGDQTLGTIRGGYLEESNVKLASAMTDMIQIQRAYQLNAKMITNADQMWSIANAIRR